MPDFDTISEIILYVEEMDRMVDFYTEVFGLEVASGAPEHGFVAFDTGACALCLHAGGDGDIGASAPKFVFEVDDLDAARSYLEAHGVELSEIRPAGPDAQACDGRDPEGNGFSIESSTSTE